MTLEVHTAGRTRRRAALVGALAVVVGSACGGVDPEGPVAFTVPAGAGFAEVSDTLVARGLVGSPTAFRLYARIRGADRQIKSGGYVLPGEAGWGEVLDALTRGTVATEPLTIPEGFRLAQIAPRIAALSDVQEDSIQALVADSALWEDWDLPGPTLEGYLFPDTYRFAPGVAPRRVLQTMVDRYRSVWTPERRARLDSLELSERELVTLASIIQAEARQVEEMPRIASVYHNRLRDGWLLQADPTVQYALGGPRERLLYAAIDSVADDPYNTYTQAGLPPGPIGAPGERALDAALWPADESFWYFVARPDGSHVFSRTLAEHNRAKALSRRMLDSLARESDGR